MEVLEDRLEKEAVLALLGNGRDDVRVVGAVATKLDGVSGEKLALPSGTSLVAARTGGLAIIDSLRVYVEKFGVSRFLVVLDKEHVKNLSQVVERFGKLGMEVEAEELSENLLRVRGLLGYRRFWAAVAVLGTQEHPRLEYHLSQIIKCVCGVEVEPTKQAIKSELRKRGKRIDEVLEKASQKLFEKCIPQLVEALKELSKRI